MKTSTRRFPSSFSPAPGQERAFALVATITLLVLVALICLGLLSLSTISLRGSQQADAQARAQFNARLGLLMALGQLQKLTGPDQRVTADGSRDPDTTRKHWTGVWKTTNTSGANEVPVVRWDSSASSVVDDRSSGSTNPASLFQGWLVSGWPTPSSDKVTLVGAGSVADPATQSVQVPAVTMQGQNNRNGRLAFWVGDESVKAAVAVPDYLANAQPSAPGDDGYKRMMLPQNVGIEVIPGMEQYKDATAPMLEKVTDIQQAELAGPWGAAPFSQKFHSLAANSYSVLSDTLRGGLKRDMSVFLETGTASSRGPLLPQVTVDTPLLNDARRAQVGPKMGAFREWSKLADLMDANGKIDPIPPQKTFPSAIGFSQSPYRAFNRFPDLRAGNAAVHPVMASVMVYTRVAYARGSITMHFYPRIIMWNPYNATIKAKEYMVDVNFGFEDPGRYQIPGSNPATYHEIRFNSKNNTNRMRLRMEATEFLPGEALMFSPLITGGALGGNSVPMNPNATNIMSATVNPRLMTNYYLVLGNAQVTANQLPVSYNHNVGNGWMDYMDWSSANPGNGMKASLFLVQGTTPANYNAMYGQPALQFIDMDNWKRGNGGAFNCGRWRTLGTENLYNYETTATMEPFVRAIHGFRYRWPVEVNASNLSGTGANRMWNAAVLSDFNLRAAMCHRSPYDNVTDTGEFAHWYMWGPFTQEKVQGLPLGSSDIAAHQGPNGTYRSNPFFGGSRTSVDTVYPLFDLPTRNERIVSLGSFQHVGLTSFLWHPTYAVGSSWVSTTVKDRSRTADPYNTVQGQWSSEVTYLPAWYRSMYGNDQVIYDLAYEANYELWDKYFLSGSLSSEHSGFASSPTTNRLPNARLVPTLNAATNVGKLDDYYQAASQLYLRGGFNVNSMDRDAWRALLSSLKDVKIPVKSGTNNATGVPFSRFRNPITGGVQPTDPYSTSSWAGYRNVSDQEINQLADEIVKVVRERGPFLSLADFVNRRLVPASGTSAAHGLMGALQQAIENAGMNPSSLLGGDFAMNLGGYGASQYEPGNNAAAWSERNHLRTSKAYGMPTCLQQGDILQSLGATLTARGDTFRIRAYGEARDGTTVSARAWCEAVVQRTPEYLDPASAAEQPAYGPDGAVNDLVSDMNRRFGRRYQVLSFRWLHTNEV